MGLYKKIMAIYPELKEQDFYPEIGTIRLQNDSDGKGDYIASWEHPDLARPTDAELKGVC